MLLEKNEYLEELLELKEKKNWKGSVGEWVNRGLMRYNTSACSFLTDLMFLIFK